MFLAKDHAAFDMDRKRSAVWTDIRHLQCGFALKSGNTEKCDSMGEPCREVAGLFYLEVKRTGETL
jgi:hypothetical protein